VRKGPKSHVMRPRGLSRTLTTSSVRLLHRMVSPAKHVSPIGRNHRRDGSTGNGISVVSSHDCVWRWATLPSF
jgi:hypothetical protein